MRMLSNGYGSVRNDGKHAYGYRHGELRGDFPMPMSEADALLMMEYCLAEFPGDGCFRVGVTGSYTLAELTGLPRRPVPEEKGAA